MVATRQDLLVAAWDGSLDRVQKILERNPNWKDIQDNWGETPVHRASNAGHLDVVTYLANRCQANVNVRNFLGNTPLHVAACKGNWTVCQHLVEHCRADVKIENKDGWTPLHWASARGNLEMVHFLAGHGGTHTIDRQDKCGATALFLAVSGGCLDIARCLVLSHGADMAQQARRGYTPLHSASWNNHVDLVRFLVVQGAAAADDIIHVRDNCGRTPLHAASEAGHLEATRFLLQHGADVTIRNKKGETPLDVACARGHHNVICVLLGRFLFGHM
eukprot:CAMPEP_0168728694 /NCGR_PEP_ID=MMETSP0724-20121128/5816_1 /TAXON_ID=265536 /ORGANISM="Amphiprora sp., Strain CCMP467" /LENGTH=274 /DNA_ID=CAMNT_0008775547 /DNA_START=195 /DNA_END=1019 /DNA_ORIENTATION=-